MKPTLFISFPHAVENKKTVIIESLVVFINNKNSFVNLVTENSFKLMLQIHYFCTLKLVGAHI